ncbi:MAG: glycosyltransferase, partial [Candidatus Pacebacteria bacterium]|nr:glycosyltransferase [Candidatus Paceibacterota bacterium]
MPNDRAHGIQIAYTCNAMARVDIAVTLLIPKRWGVTDEDVRRYYVLDPSIRIRRVRVIDASRVVPGYLSFFIRMVSFSVGALWYAVTHTRKHDVVYTRGEMVFPLALCAWRYRLCWETHSKPSRVWLYRIVLRAVHEVVTVTHYYADELVNMFGVARGRVLVAPDAVDLVPFRTAYDQESTRATLGVSNNKTILLYTGSDQKWKGVDVLKEVVRHLPDTYLLVFVGQIHNDTGDDARFHYAGFQHHEDIPRWLAVADYLMLTGNINDTLSSRYTSPLKLFEYMASGKPIIAFEIPSFREVLDDTTACFVPATDPQRIALSIEALMPERARQCAVQACRVVERYTWDARA